MLSTLAPLTPQLSDDGIRQDTIGCLLGFMLVVVQSNHTRGPHRRRAQQRWFSWQHVAPLQACSENSAGLVETDPPAMRHQLAKPCEGTTFMGSPGTVQQLDGP